MESVLTNDGQKKGQHAKMQVMVTVTVTVTIAVTVVMVRRVTT